MSIRVGIGFDAHRFKSGRNLILGGVDVPHTAGLDGHSDADVLVHAIADALLGAAVMGDIGSHFPDTDPRYKGIRSILLLERVGALIAQKGYAVENVDSVIIAQVPKLLPYIDEMRNNIGSALGVDADRIGVKATTTEHMGYTGREEGIAAQAVVCLSCMK